MSATRLREVWIVTDPNPNSEWPDIFYRFSIPEFLKYVIGTGTRLWKIENTAIHVTEASARADAISRLTKLHKGTVPEFVKMPRQASDSLDSVWNTLP